jgi:glycosyltransferase involved in cell wall biosynthesis
MEASVIIPARNRAGQLKLALDALDTQQTDSRFEIIVVDDGSTDGTKQVCEAHQSVKYISLQRTVDDKLRKAAEARNLGARSARGNIFIFLDADMVPDEHFVKNHINAHRIHSSEHLVVLGLRKEVRDSSIVQDSREPYFNAFKDDVAAMDDPWSLLYSHNFSVSKDDFKRVGGFSTYFDVWGAEDQELGYKLFMNGARFMLDRSLVAFHLPHETEYQSELSRRAGVLKNALKFYNHYKDERISRVYGLDRKRAVLPLHDACNNNCSSCTKMNFGSASSSDVERFLDSVPKGWRIVLNGGEPLLHPDFFTIARSVAARGYMVELETNGRAFRYERLCEKCFPSITTFTVKLFGHTPEFHDYITKVRGSFRQTVSGIRNLVRRCDAIALHLAVPDAARAADMLRFGRSLGASAIQMSFCDPDMDLVLGSLGDPDYQDVTFRDPWHKCISVGRALGRGCPNCSIAFDCKRFIKGVI